MSNPVENPKMTADEAFMDLLQNVMDWRKQVRQGQDTGRLPDKQDRAEWVKHFHAWFEARENG